MEAKISALANIITVFSKFFSKLGNILNEEQVMNFIVRPIVERVWEFAAAPIELGEPGTYETEVKVAIGHDNYCYPDLLLLCQGDKKLVIEVKSTEENLDKWVSQLECEVNASGAAVGILWNGTEMRVYVRNNGKMDTTPYKTVYFLALTEEDNEFLAKFFDPRHCINDAQMKREMLAKQKEEASKARIEKIINHLVERAISPSDNTLKDAIREADGVSQVYESRLNECRTIIVPQAIERLKSTLAANAVAEYKRQQAQENHLEPMEAALGALGKWHVKQNQGSIDFIDDDVAERSILVRSDNHKTILWIVGDVTEEGYSFKGIAFPNKAKGRGKVLPIEDPMDLVEKYGDLLMGVYDHVGEPDWTEYYETHLAG